LAVKLAFQIAAKGILVVPPLLVLIGVGSYVYFALYDRRIWARWFLVITGIAWPALGYFAGRRMTFSGLIGDLITLSVVGALIFPSSVKAFFSKEAYAESTPDDQSPTPS